MINGNNGDDSYDLGDNPVRAMHLASDGVLIWICILNSILVTASFVH